MPEPAKVEVPPQLAERLFQGEITIGELVGLSRKTQYAIANVGHQLMQTGATEKALNLFKGLVAASPYDSVFHAHLGALYNTLERYEEAFHHYDEAVRYNVANVDALAGRGELYLRMRKVPQAIADLTKAVKSDATRKRPSAKRAAAMLMMLDQRMKSAGKKTAAAPAKKPAAKAAPAKKK